MTAGRGAAQGPGNADSVGDGRPVAAGAGNANESGGGRPGTTGAGNPAARQGTGGAASVPRRLVAQTAMELRLTLRNGESLLVTFGIPVGLLVFFSLVDVLPTGSERPVDFLVPGVLTLSVMSASMVALAIATGFERYWLVLKRLGVTPLRRGELITAKIAAVSLVQVLQILAVLGVAMTLLDYRPVAGGQAPLWLAPIAMVLGTSAFAGLGLAMAGRLRAVATLALANAAYLLLLLISGIAFPLDRLPDWLAMLARALPAAPLAELLRAALGGPAHAVPTNLLVLAAWAVGAPALAARIFRWE